MQSNNLLDIKRRINSVKSTQKITKAMEMISISKLRSARESFEIRKDYLDNIDSIMDKINYICQGEENILKEERNSGKQIIVVIGSDSGLCGGFNGQGLDYIEKKYSKEEVIIIGIGKRTLAYIKKYKFNLYKLYEIENLEIGNLEKELLELYKDGEKFKSISLVFVKYISTIRQEVKEEILLPFRKDIKRLEEVYNTNAKLGDLFKMGVEKYIGGKLLEGVLNSKISEESLRMQAMNVAGKNADEMLRELKGKYNRIRQSNITKEITEIVSGAEAQK